MWRIPVQLLFLKLSAEGELLKSYERPTTVTFGQKTQYVPSKIAVNPSGILYVVSEGSFNGIVQLNRKENSSDISVITITL